jgi:hypothetical protein
MEESEEESDGDLDVRGLGEIIRDFLILREGKISHLTIPTPGAMLRRADVWK